MALFARARMPGFGPNTSLADLRSYYASLFGRFGPVPPDCRYEKAQLGLIKGEWLNVPSAVRQRMILYFHGGGFIAGSPETHRPLVARLCHAAQGTAFSVAYRLAPECPFPSAVRDGVDAFRYLITHDVAPESIVLAGDGAGGGLAFSVLLAIRNGELPMPAGVAAMSPWADLTLSGMAIMENAPHDCAMTWELLFLSARQTLNKANPSDPYASPAFASFKGFPPIMVHAGSREILRDDASRLGDRAAESDVPVNVEIYDGMQHLFQADAELKEARASMTRLGNFIRTRTSSQPAVPRPHAPANGSEAATVGANAHDGDAKPLQMH
jgi:epsilon-lactone hydrolase